MRQELDGLLKHSTGGRADHPKACAPVIPAALKRTRPPPGTRDVFSAIRAYGLFLGAGPARSVAGPPPAAGEQELENNCLAGAGSPGDPGSWTPTRTKLNPSTNTSSTPI
jgi:hypothetical protein